MSCFGTARDNARSTPAPVSHGRYFRFFRQMSLCQPPLNLLASLVIGSHLQPPLEIPTVPPSDIQSEEPAGARRNARSLLRSSCVPEAVEGEPNVVAFRSLADSRPGRSPLGSIRTAGPQRT